MFISEICVYVTTIKFTRDFVAMHDEAIGYIYSRELLH